jgi:hypothetical protein
MRRSGRIELGHVASFCVRSSARTFWSDRVSKDPREIGRSGASP